MTPGSIIVKQDSRNYDIKKFTVLFCRILLALLMLSCLDELFGSSTTRYTNKLLAIIANEEVVKANEIFYRYGIHYKHQVVGRVHEYYIPNTPEISPTPLDEAIFRDVMTRAGEVILEIYQVEEVIYDLKIDESEQHPLRLEKQPTEKSTGHCTTSTGLDVGVYNAWSLGYHGEGVVVAVVDVGVEVTHSDLASNINLGLSRNFVENQETHDVNPDITIFYRKLDVYSDHGTNCAGLIAAIKDNDICGAGVAPQASLSVLKIAEVQVSDKFLRSLQSWRWEAFSYRHDAIHIYSCSFGPAREFSSEAKVTDEVFRVGVEKGRNGTGTIYVVGAGNEGKTKKNLNLDCYANSVYTVTINGVDYDGSVPDFVQPGTVVLASTYGTGINSSCDPIKTTSHGNSCRDDFKGTSASAALAAGVIALVLQANPSLSWRDIQHLIVNTSSIYGLHGNKSVKPNAAGYLYHEYFGFGLMNATALVMNAKNWTTVPPQFMIYADSTKRGQENIGNVHSMSIDMCEPSAPCLTFIEHVVAYVEYSSYFDPFVGLKLCAPSHTCSNVLTKQVLNSHVPRKELVQRKWKFMTLQFWGESAVGKWTLRMYLSVDATVLKGRPFGISYVNLSVYGHTTKSPGDDNSYKAILNVVIFGFVTFVLFICWNYL